MVGAYSGVKRADKKELLSCNKEFSTFLPSTKVDVFNLVSSLNRTYIYIYMSGTWVGVVVEICTNIHAHNMITILDYIID